MPKILVVDDEVGIRELLSEILRDEGHDVQLAENAAGVFEGTPTAYSAMPGGHDPEKLFAEIGRLKMENDLLKKTVR